MSAHTPGPWSPIAQGAANEFCIISKDGRWVIGFHQNGEMLPREQLANAQLMATSPRLLAALEALVKTLAFYDDEGLIVHAVEMVEARAAIAQARGTL